MGKKMAVFGAGAIGSTIGVYLARAGEDITLIDPWFLHIETIKREGLRVTAPDEEFTAPVKALNIDETSQLEGPLDILFLAVKSYDTEWATRLMIPYMKPDAFVVSAQNSLNEERIASIIGPERTMGCVVAFGGGLYEAGYLNRTSDSKSLACHLGELDGSMTSRLEELANILAPLGRMDVTGNIWGELWSKLAVNCMSNSIAGVTSMGSGEWRGNPVARRIGVRIGAEVVQVAQALGYTIEPLMGGITPEAILATAEGKSTEAYERLEEFAATRFSGASEGRPSLLQDALKGRRTEVEYLNGLIVEKGKQVGVEAPANAAIAALVKKVEMGELKPERSNLEFLSEFA